MKKWIIIGVVLIIFIGFFLFGYLSYRGIRIKGEAVVKAVKAISSSLKNNNIDEVKMNLATLEEKYADFENESQKIYWLSYVPFLGSYVADFKNGVVAGDNLIKAGSITVETVSPYADLIGFKKGASKFVEKSADDRIQTAVLTLDKMLIKVDDIAAYVDKARESLDKINVNKYPKKIWKTEVRSKIKNIRDQFDGLASLFVDSKPLLKKLPTILGTDKEKTYLVLFQNDKELRPTGGFLTAYSIFKVKEGRFKAVKSGDIYSLDSSISSRPKAPQEISTYHKGVSKFNIRDSNLSPDFVKSLELFNSLYEKSNQKVEYDGVMTVDTKVLVDILKILGDTEADGIFFSANIDKRCDCPQVIYKLFDMIDRPVNYVKTNRKGILGDLLYVIMQKALGFSPSRYWGRIAQDMIKNLQEKHILVYLKDQDAQQSIEKMNFGGRIKQYEGDYLHVNDTNFAGAKANLFVSHTVTSDTQTKGDGTVERTLTIEYKNPYPHSDCSLERGGLCLNAALRNWLRIYVPVGSQLVGLQGSEMPVKTYDDLGKTVFEGFLKVNPKGKATVVVKYTLPFKIKKETDYNLLIQKQPGTEGHSYKILINGKEKKQFKLVQDTELKME